MNDYYKLTHAHQARLKDNQQMHLFQHTLQDWLKKWKLTLRQVVRWHELNLLSFEPQLNLTLEPIQEAELSFVVSLYHAGCDEQMMLKLLEPLQKPYCYQRNNLVYDFTQKKWLARLNISDHELTIEGRIKQAQQDKNVRMLREIIQEASRAMMQIAEELIQDNSTNS